MIGCGDQVVLPMSEMLWRNWMDLVAELKKRMTEDPLSFEIDSIVSFLLIQFVDVSKKVSMFSLKSTLDFCRSSKYNDQVDCFDTDDIVDECFAFLKLIQLLE